MPIDALAMQIRLEHVSRRFDTTTAIDNVSLTVRAGEFLTVTGPPGCGKSTLVRLIAGMDAPSSGTVRVEGDGDARQAGHRPPRFVSVEELTAETGGDTPAETPPCVLCDDPLAHVKGPARTARRDEILTLHATLGTTFVCASGDPDDALAMSSRIVLLQRGRLLQCASPTEMLEAPATECVARYFGRPAINLVPAILEKDGQAILLGNQTISLRGRIDEVFCRDITVGVRPAHVRLDTAGVGWRGRVASIEPHADAALVEVEVEGIRLRAFIGAGAGARPRAGDAVGVRILPKHFIVFDDHGVHLAQV